MTNYFELANSFLTIETYKDLQFIQTMDKDDGKTTLSVWNDTTKVYVIEKHPIEDLAEMQELINQFKEYANTGAFPN